MTLNEKKILKNLIKQCIREEWTESTKAVNPQRILDNIVYKRKEDIRRTIEEKSQAFQNNLVIGVSNVDSEPIIRLSINLNPTPKGLTLNPAAGKINRLIFNIDGFIENVNSISPSGKPLIEDTETFKQIMEEINIEFQQKLKEAKSIRKKRIKALQEYIVEKAKKDAKTNDKKKKSLISKYYEDDNNIPNVKLLRQILDELQQKYIKLFSISFPELSALLNIENPNLKILYQDTLIDEQSKIQQARIAAKQGIGTIEDEWPDQKTRDLFLDWLYAYTKKITVVVDNQTSADKILDIAGSFSDDIENNIIFRQSKGLGFDSWVLYLTNDAKAKLIEVRDKDPEQLTTYFDTKLNQDMDESILKKFIDWKVGKYNGRSANKDDLNNIANWPISPVYSFKDNNITGNRIVRDLVFEYGFVDKLSNKDVLDNEEQ